MPVWRLAAPAETKKARDNASAWYSTCLRRFLRAPFGAASIASIRSSVAPSRSFYRISGQKARLKPTSLNAATLQARQCAQKDGLPIVKYSDARPLNSYRPPQACPISETPMIVTTVPQQWTALQQRPLFERILAMPAEVCDFVRQVNLASGLDAEPVAAEPDAAMRADLQEALRGMPGCLLDPVDPLLLGICLGRNIGSSGVTDIVVDKADGRILGCVVLLDVDAFAGHTANSWASWKENLPFELEGGIALDVVIAAPEQDTRAGALQFLLLHEFAHVLTLDAGFLPAWWAEVPDAPFPFLDLSWERTPLGRFAPRPGRDFALRAEADFYGANKLPNDAILTAYSGLEGSDFPSLYGATNPYDDFAECLATWVHVEVLQRPFRLQVAFDGVAQATLDSFWTSPRSKAKRAFMRRLFDPAPLLCDAAACDAPAWAEPALAAA